MWFTNTATSTRWLKCYNDTAANVTVGTTTPVITLGLPGNATDDIAGNLGTDGMGVPFSTAITCAVTTGVADNDTGAPSANDVIVNIFYKCSRPVKLRRLLFALSPALLFVAMLLFDVA